MPDPRPIARVGVTTFALVQVAVGAALLFAADDVSVAFMAPAGRLAVQMWGAALLGFAAMDWTARGSVLGGIYGRAVVIGNQTHFTVGVLLLLGHALEPGAAPATFWALGALYVVGAVFFGYLAFVSSGFSARYPGTQTR